MTAPYDRRLGDVGNIVKLEHVNLTVPDQRLATIFYLMGLGLTRDPFVNVGIHLMWVNVGQQQFHLPTAPQPQRLRGRSGLILPSRDALLKRLETVAPLLEGTEFAVEPGEDAVDLRSPWGDRLRCHFPDRARFGALQLGIPYVELDIPAGTAEGIVRFYQQVFDAPAALCEAEGAPAARIPMGDQWMLMIEREAPLPEYDGHHLQIYVSDFSGPYRRLAERGLITRETSAHEYRFQSLFDPATGQELHALEQEVRSLLHPIYGRRLVNRNPIQTGVNYIAGADALETYLV